jgi:UDP-glucose 4-epimerase
MGECMKILVTGNSGLLGYHLLPLLSEHEVFGVARTNRHNHENVFCADLANTELVDLVFDNFKPDVVIHLAACAAEARGQVSPVDMVQRNLLLTTNVLKSSINAGVKKFIYASSVSVYGDSPTPYSEENQPHPKDVYGVNKFAGEQVIKIMSEVYGFDYTILRPHNLYGEGQNINDLTKNVINIFMRKLLENKPYAIMGDGSVRRGFSYAGDVATMFKRALTEWSKQTLNVGTVQSNTIGELSSLLQEVSGSTVPVERLPLRKQEIDVFIADHKLQTGYHETPLKEGLEKTWKWISKQELGEVVEIPKEICLDQK